MKNLLISFAFVVFSLATINCFESYKNYKVYDVTPTKEQYNEFEKWQFEEGIDFFRLRAANMKSVVMVTPEVQKEFESFLAKMEISYEISINDLEPLLEEERRNMTRNRQSRSSVFPGMVPDFSVYWSSQEMEQYCSFLAQTYPQFIQMETLGLSPAGGRRIYGLRISNNLANFGSKPVIAMESGMHAREWASPPTVLYLIHRLVEVPSSRNELLANIDWLIVPMQNPDGYEWSRSNTRLWRQNRRQVSEVNPTCVGVDLNRNWAYSWRAPTVACGSQTYPGPTPLSEPENRMLYDFVDRYSDSVVLYLSVHTFGDMILWPWGYSGSPGWISTSAQHIALGNRWRDGILDEGGRPYINGNVADVLGNAFGAVDDHMVGYFGIDYVYTLEITSGFNFIYPEDRVEVLVKETFFGYRGLALEIARQFAKK